MVFFISKGKINLLFIDSERQNSGKEGDKILVIILA